MFQLTNTDSQGIRHGRVHTPHGTLETPVFLPDATRGYVKTLDNRDLTEAGVEAMVVNTYHLFLQPGTDIIKKAGGIHEFMGWTRPLVSDSGGYQVFSLVQNLARRKNGKKPLGKISDEGVYFQSPVDGKEHLLTPEKSIEIQFDLGTDIIVSFDDCPPNEAEKKQIEKSVERTIAWGARCREEYLKQIKKRKIPAARRPLAIAVIQGGEYKDLRKICFDGLCAAGWDGYGFGARHVNSQGKFLKGMLKYTAELIPENKIRFALGIGTPNDILQCARLGYDMFDCVIPTREGRHGRLFQAKEGELLRRGKIYYNGINITNSRYKKDFSSAGRHKKAYLYYLLKNNESLGQRIASINNLSFYAGLLESLRRKYN
ncbi:MAG: tRNA guanosine(34) transglycosylase Tgt [Patescibacteria group bacterium]|jgi:queuine tRNA-ribosyltransferase